MLVRNAGSVTGPVSAYMSLLLANERITTPTKIGYVLHQAHGQALVE